MYFSIGIQGNVKITAANFNVDTTIDFSEYPEIHAIYQGVLNS